MKTCTGVTRATAWLRAARLLLEADTRIYNLVVEIQQPALATAQSRAIEASVDNFLVKHNRHPLHTVAETIFPAAEYKARGLAGVYAYPETVYEAIKTLPANRRGTYVQRLVRRKASNGELLNPLQMAIEKLRTQLSNPGPQRAIYELDLTSEPLELKFYDPEIDHANLRSGQCLSHISLKLGPNRELYLTALYRYQYFVQKTLGNFRGLARLQACIARELGLSIGPIVCHATLAILEDDRVGEGWRRSDVRNLIHQCPQEPESSIDEPAA